MKTDQYLEKIEECARPMISRMGERMHDIQHRVGEHARDFGQTADEYVHDHPWQTVAIIGLTACLLGFLLGNRR